MIEFLIWVFTNKLERVMWLNISDGYPTAEEQVQILKRIQEEYKCRCLLTCDNSNSGTTIKFFYIKK